MDPNLNANPKSVHFLNECERIKFIHIKLKVMKVFSILSFYFIFSLNFINSQNNNPGFCGFENVFPACYDNISGIPCSGWTPTDGGTLRVVIHLIKRQDCSGGLNGVQVTNLINTLSSDFNQFGIYINVICIKDLCNDNFYSDPRPLITQLFQTDVYPDAFNLYIQDQLFNGLQGTTSTANPSNKLWACYSTDLKIITHELGHQLALEHTSTCQYGYECVPRNNSNAWEAGDKICDTDADPGEDLDSCMIDLTENWNDKYSHWGCTPQVAPNCTGIRFQTPILNIMRTYTNSCQTEFTPGQGERMRQAIHCIENEAFQGDGNIAVKISQTWQVDKTFDVDLLIKSGVTLTINSTVRMATNRKIIVEGGANLIVDGGKLTKGNNKPFCGSDDTGPFWRGVQLGSPGTSGRAFVYFTHNATMEYSYHGCYNSPGALGYLSMIENSKFLNNRSAINSMSASSVGMWVVVNNSKFEINSLYPGTDLFHQIKLGGGRAFISNSTIENLSSINATGIAAIQELNCLLSINDCEKIKGYYYGVDAMGGGSMPYSVNNSIFQNLYTCIRSRGVNSFSITNNNQFKINGFGTQATGIGIELNKGNKFLINSNQFINQDQNNIKNDGIKILDTHPSAENYISKDNTFTRLTRGIFTEFGQNSVGVNDNLYFTCNDFIQCADDIKLDPATSINNIQRFGNAATGNSFSSLPNLYNFYNNSVILDLSYWYNSNNIIEYPERRLKVTPIPKPPQINTPRCYINPPPCPLCPQRDDQYNQLVIDINGITGQLNQLLDGGQSSYWLSIVQNANSSNSSEVYASLSNLSPNISSSLMIVFWQRIDIFTVEQRIQLLQNNLALIENSDFRKFFLDNSSDISPITITSILGSTLPESSRLSLERSLRQKQVELNWVISTAIQDLYNVEIEDLNPVLVWYDRIGSLDAKMDKAMYQLHSFDFSNLQITLTQIQGLNGLDSYEVLERIKFINLMTILSTAYINNRFEGSLNEPELQSLNSIAISGNTRSAQFAINILKFYYDIDPQENQELIGNKTSISITSDSIKNNLIKLSDFNSQEVLIYPNPASDHIVVECVKASDLIVSIYDHIGNLLYYSKENNHITSYNIETIGWTRGLYFVRVEVDGLSITKKLILK